MTSWRETTSILLTLWGESNDHSWIPSQRANNAEHWCFFELSLNKLSCQWSGVQWRALNIIVKPLKYTYSDWTKVEQHLHVWITSNLSEIWFQECKMILAYYINKVSPKWSLVALFWEPISRDTFKNTGNGDEDTLQWRHNGRHSCSDHQPHDGLLNRLFRCRSKKLSKLRVTGLCTGNSPMTGEFPATRASNAENFPIWWRHHDLHYSEKAACVLSGLIPDLVWFCCIPNFGHALIQFLTVNQLIKYYCFISNITGYFRTKRSVARVSFRTYMYMVDQTKLKLKADKATTKTHCMKEIYCIFPLKYITRGE